VGQDRGRRSAKELKFSVTVNRIHCLIYSLYRGVQLRRHIVMKASLVWKACKVVGACFCRNQ